MQSCYKIKYKKLDYKNKLGDQNYHEDINKFFKPMTD